MNCHISYSWNHDFPRLIRDTGFQFAPKYPKILIDWNAVGNIDIDKVIDSREVITLEQHLNDIIYYRVQREESKLLDQRFLKLFRLAQLTIEYLLFCLHYLDQGLVQLQKSVVDLTEERENFRKERSRKDKNLNKYKKQINELQTMLSTSLPAVFTCSICNKQFISLEYLEAHQLKRHTEKLNLENNIHPEKYEEQLQLEIKQLKERLNNAERMLNTTTSKNTDSMLLKQDCVEKCPSVSMSTQCNLLELGQMKVNDEEEQIKLIKNELQKWKEQEQVEFLSQLEQLKSKLYLEIEKLQPPKIEECSNQNFSDKTSIKSKEEIKDSSVVKKETTLNLEIEAIAETLTKKVKSHIDQLQDQLVKQEKRWQTCLIQLEQKHNTEFNQIKPSLPVKVNDSCQTNFSKNNSDSSLESSILEIPLQIKRDTENRESSNKTLKVTQDIQNEKNFKNEERKETKSIHSVKTKEESKINSKTPSESYNLLQKKMLPETIVKNDMENQLFQLNKNVYLDDSIIYNNVPYDTKIISRSINSKHNKTSSVLLSKSNSQQHLISKPIISQYNKVVQQIKQKKHNNLLKRNDVIREQKKQNKTDSVLMNSDAKYIESENYKIKQSNKISLVDSSNITSTVEYNKDTLSNCALTVKNMLTKKLHEMGIDPSWQTLPSETLKKHICNLQHSQKLISKSYPAYFQLCNKILSVIEKRTTERMKTKKYSLDVDIQENMVKSERISQNKDIKAEISNQTMIVKNTTANKTFDESKKNLKENLKIDIDVEKESENTNIPINYFSAEDENQFKPIKLKNQLSNRNPNTTNLHSSSTNKYFETKQISADKDENSDSPLVRNENKGISYKNSRKSSRSVYTPDATITSSSSESLKQDVLVKISAGRSVLKSAESVGSLTRKKVFFDIHSSKSDESSSESNVKKFSSMYESKQKQINVNNTLSDTQDLHKNVGNVTKNEKNLIMDEETSSISSSIFEGSRNNINSNNKETTVNNKKNMNELDDLIISDFDSLS